MDINRKTFEDLLGNLADDAKQAFDEILERPSAKQTAGAGVGQVTTTAGSPVGATGGLAGTAGGVAGTAGDVTSAAGDLAALPRQIAQLSELIARLLPAVEGLAGALSSIKPMGEAATTAPPGRQPS